MQTTLSDSRIDVNPRNLLNTLRTLRQEVFEEGNATFVRWESSICRRDFLISAHNLAYYLALRKRDLRPLQAALTPWGLSSLDGIESRVLPTLDALIATLGAVCGEDIPHPRSNLFARGERVLQRQTEQVFGPMPTDRRVRIMVTAPTEATHNYAIIRDLMLRGMDSLRLNCAHDTPVEWDAVINNVRRAEAETGRTCKVIMDLCGPRLRTEHIIAPEKGRLRIGDTLRLTKDKPVPSPEFEFQAQCSLPQIFEQAKVGAHVWIDEGKLGCVIESATPQEFVLRVTHASSKGEKLKTERGLNFPDTELILPALTDQDLIDLDYVANNADIIDYSFVQDANDIRQLQAALAERLENPHKIAIVAKMETQRAINNLPEIMVQAAGQNPFGVLIARGDLAVEIGYERLVEMQEQILWLCEAAHVPVIWATQVLETLVRKGRPSRAEMTDAAVAGRSECVLLNKGTYVREAVTVLDDVLRRMDDHQSKKTSLLGALNSW